MAEQHALWLLRQAESWKWVLPIGSRHSSEHPVLVPRLLSGFLVESHKLGGSLIEEFWTKLGDCDPKLKLNIAKLKQCSNASTPNDTVCVLFGQISRAQIDFAPVLDMAADLFTRIVVPFVNRAPKLFEDEPPRHCDFVELNQMDSHSLLCIVSSTSEANYRKDLAMQRLLFKRDKHRCLITKFYFDLDDQGGGVTPSLAHFVPRTFRDKEPSLELLASFAGVTVAAVQEDLNSVHNAMNLQWDVYISFVKLWWSIEAQKMEDGMKVKYLFRQTIADTDENRDEYEDLLLEHGDDDDDAPSSIFSLKDGDEIKFGRGSGIDLTPNSESHFLPSPLLCNIHLAVARAVQNTGALDLIEQIAEDADDTHSVMTQEQFSEALTAKLVLAS